MPVIGLTGGVASGKSVFLEHLTPLLPKSEVYDADAAVHRLLKEGCKQEVVERFGDRILGEDGEIDRRILRKWVLDDKQARLDLEAILHPAVEREWRSLVARVRRTDFQVENVACNWLILVIPLLFEVGADAEMDVTVVVACRPATQIRRMTERRGLETGVAEKFLAAQWPLAEKIARCDFLIWNDGPKELLESQAKILSNRLNAHARRESRTGSRTRATR